MKANRENWYKQILDSISDFVFVKGRNSELVWANKSLREYYNLREEDLGELIDADHGDPDNVLQYVNDDMEVIRTGNVLNIESEEIISIKGEGHLFNTIKSPIRDENGEIQFLVGVSRALESDFHTTKIKSKQSYEEAKAFTAPLRSFSSNFPMPTLLLDVNSRIVVCNRHWQDEFGTYTESHNNFFQNCYKILEEVNDSIGQALASQKVIVKTINIKQGQSNKFFEIKCCPWFYKSGELGGTCLAANDVTRLMIANDELAQFAYRASHDLKAPLSTIKMYSQLLLSDIENDNKEEMLNGINTIIKRTDQLEKLVVDILNLARADLESTVNDNVNLNKIVDGIVESHKDEILQQNIEIQKKINFDTSISIAKIRITQILDNLISNSIKYLDPNKKIKFIRITLDLNNDQLAMTVTDNGIGIPTEYHNQVFQMFKRFHHEAAPGSGLGLSIIKKHVLSLNGQISFESSTEGTSFFIQIPVTKGVSNE